MALTSLARQSTDRGHEERMTLTSAGVQQRARTECARRRARAKSVRSTPSSAVSPKKTTRNSPLHLRGISNLRMTLEDFADGDKPESAFASLSLSMSASTCRCSDVRRCWRSPEARRFKSDQPARSHQAALLEGRCDLACAKKSTAVVIRIFPSASTR